MVTVDQLRTLVRADARESDDYLESVLASGTQLVADYVDGATVPTQILDQAVLVVAAELRRQGSPAGQGQTVTATVGPARARDPLGVALPLLARYVRPF